MVEKLSAFEERVAAETERVMYLEAELRLDRLALSPFDKLAFQYNDILSRNLAHVDFSPIDRYMDTIEKALAPIRQYEETIEKTMGPIRQFEQIIEKAMGPALRYQKQIANSLRAFDMPALSAFETSAIEALRKERELLEKMTQPFAESAAAPGTERWQIPTDLLEPFVPVARDLSSIPSLEKRVKQWFHEVLDEREAALNSELQEGEPPYGRDGEKRTPGFKK